MAQEETLRYKIQVDTSEAQPVVQNMVSSVGQAISTTFGYAQAGVQGVQNTANFAAGAVGQSYNTLQQGYGYAMPALQGAGGSLQAGMSHVQNVRSSYSGGATTGVYQGAQDAAAAFNDPTRNFGSTMATGAAYAGAAMVGWTGVQVMSDAIGGIGTRTLFRSSALTGAANAGGGGLATMGARMGGGLMGRLGLGTAGRAVGALAGGAAALMLPFIAADMAINKVMDDVAERNETANAIGQYDKMYRGPFSGSGTGSRFSKRDRTRMADFMKDYAEEIDRADFGQGKMGMKGLTQVLSGFQQQIFRDPNLTPQKFREVFTKKVEMVRDFAMAFDKTIGESIGLIKKIQSVTGFSQDPRQTAAMVGAASNVSGISTVGMLGMMQQGSDQYLAQGLTRQAGANAAIQGAADFGTMLRTGMVSRNDFARVGGTKGMTQMQIALQGAFTSGPFGQMVAAAALGPGGQLNQGVVNNIISGRIGSGQMLGMASGIAGGGINALSNFYANKDKMVQQMSAVQQQGLVGSMAIRMLNMTGMDTNQANLQTVFKSQFGMSAPAARIMATRMMNPDIYQKQMDANYDRIMQKARTAERSQHGWGSWMYRGLGLEAAGKWMSRVGTGFRRNISNPVGDWINSVGKDYMKFKDRITGTQRLTLDDSVNDISNLYDDASAADASNASISALRGGMIKGSKEIFASAQRIRDAGGKEPEWVKLVLDNDGGGLGLDGMVNLGESFGLAPDIAGKHNELKIKGASSDVVKKIAAGFRMETKVMKDLQMGQSSGRNLSLKSGLLKNVNFIRGITELLQEQEDGTTFTSASAAQKIISRGGIFGLKKGASLADLTTSQRRDIGAALAQYGIKTDDRDTGTGKFDLDIATANDMKKKVKAAEDSLTQMTSSTNWFSRQFREYGKFSFSLFGKTYGDSGSVIDKKTNPFEFVYGSGAAQALSKQGKDVQAKAVQALSIMSKGGSATKEDKAKAKALLKDLMAANKTMKGSDKAAFAKLVADLQMFTIGRPGEITGNISLLGKDFRDKVDKITSAMSLGKKILASKAQATQFSRRMTFELTAEDSAGAKKQILAYLGKRGIDEDDLETVLKKVGDLGTGDVGENLRAFGKMYGEKKYKEIFEVMKMQGGAYGKIAKLGAGLSAARELQGRDLLAGVAKGDNNIKDLISGSSFKGALKNRKKARQQYELLMKRLKKDPKLQGELGKIEQTLATTSDYRERLIVMKKLIEGGSKSEGDFLARLQLRQLSGKVGGMQVRGTSSAGTYSRVAAKQIAVSQQVLQNLKIQHQTMKALYQQIKNGGK